MKANVDSKQKSNNITIFRYKIEDLEKKLTEEHEAIKSTIAIPLAQDLGVMKPSKPEATCEKDVYSGVIEGAYSKMMMTAKKELQSEIESFHIISEKQEADIKIMLIPKDPEDSKNAVLEIRAGTGGDEASIFAGDLFRMYTKFIDSKGWKIELVDTNYVHNPF